MNKNGFTIIELLAVISLLGILVTVSATSVIHVINQSRDDLLKDQIKSLGDTSLTYVASKNYYFSVCPNDFDPKNPTISYKDKCYREVSVSDVIQANLFDNQKNLCKDNGKAIIVYRVSIGGSSELKSYVPDGLCEY